jgi:hypothetical protein
MQFGLLGFGVSYFEPMPMRHRHARSRASQLRRHLTRLRPHRCFVDACETLCHPAAVAASTHHRELVHDAVLLFRAGIRKGPAASTLRREKPGSPSLCYEKLPFVSVLTPLNVILVSSDRVIVTEPLEAVCVASAFATASGP